MPFSTREPHTDSQPFGFISAVPQPITGAPGNMSLTQALTALRAEDPAFNKIISIQHLEQGAVVATAEDLARKMYVLMSGKVNLVCTNNEGRRLVITTLEPGAIFGEGARMRRATPTSMPKPPTKCPCGSSPPMKPAI